MRGYPIANFSGRSGQFSGRRGLWSGTNDFGDTLKWSAAPDVLIPPGFSLTRSSTGTYFDSAGLLQTAASDATRGTYRYNGSAWVCDGTIVEAAATNLRLQSNSFNTAPWNTAGIGAIAQNATGPLGANTAWTLTDSSAVLYQNIQAAASSVVVPGSTYTDWVLIGKTTGTPSNFPSVEIVSGALNSNAILQTTTGVATVASGAGVTWTVYNYSADFWLLAGTYVAGGATSNVILYPALSSDGTTPSVAATGSAVFCLAQTELGTAPTSYIPTTTVAVTRAADVLTGATSGKLENAQGFAAMKFRAIGNETIGAFLSSYQGAATDAIPLEIFSGALNIYDGSAFRAGNAMTLIAGSNFSIAGTWGGVNCQTALNGVASASLTFDGSMGFTSTLRIGDQVSGAVQPISMVLQSLRLGVVGKSDARLANLTV